MELVPWYLIPNSPKTEVGSAKLGYQNELVPIFDTKFEVGRAKWYQNELAPWHLIPNSKLFIDRIFSRIVIRSHDSRSPLRRRPSQVMHNSFTVVRQFNLIRYHHANSSSRVHTCCSRALSLVALVVAVSHLRAQLKAVIDRSQSFINKTFNSVTYSMPSTQPSLRQS
jgi:hypothetical protein